MLSKKKIIVSFAYILGNKFNLPESIQNAILIWRSLRKDRSRRLSHEG